MNTGYLEDYFYKNPSFRLNKRSKTSSDETATTIASDFKIIHMKNGSTFEIDTKNQISRVVWNGVINANTVQELVKKGADSVEFGSYDKLLLNRANLLEFTTEARVWLKELLKNRASKIVDMVGKVAVVKATTLKGNVFSNFIGAAIRIVMPNLQMKEFETEKEAINWLTS